PTTSSGRAGSLTPTLCLSGGVGIADGRAPRSGTPTATPPSVVREQAPTLDDGAAVGAGSPRTGQPWALGIELQGGAGVSAETLLSGRAAPGYESPHRTDAPRVRRGVGALGDPGVSGPHVVRRGPAGSLREGWPVRVRRIGLARPPVGSDRGAPRRAP